MFKRILLLFCVSLLPAISYAATDKKPFVTTRSLTLDLATQAVTAAVAECSKKGYNVTAALVDRTGTLTSFGRHPLAGSHTVGFSIEKAQTSASFQASTLELMTNPSIDPLRYANGVMLIGGGLPINIGGQFYGAIGISGAPPEKLAGDIDEECAKAGIDIIKEELEFAE